MSALDMPSFIRPPHLPHSEGPEYREDERFGPRIGNIVDVFEDCPTRMQYRRHFLQKEPCAHVLKAGNS